MCGIAGIWNYKTGRPTDTDVLRRITSSIAHRGPDGEGFYWGPGPGLGHRRLSIIDLDGGHQPMSNEDGSVWIVFNGEIYNYPELRKHLIQRGHVFRTNSDTEAIVHLYEDQGESCFEQLRGMFAIALWDQRRQRLVLARDRLGIKPLFYGLGREGIVFGSELKCIRESGLVELETEPTAIADLFTFFYIPAPKTIYRCAHVLEPGHYLVITTRGVTDHLYWDLPAGELRLATEHDYEAQLYDIFHEAVGCHLLSDVPVGAFLSGGVDSSSVVALMSTFSREPFMTCSIGFGLEEYNELPQARAVAQRFSTDHHEQVVTPEPAKILETLTTYYDQPFPDDSAVPTYYVSRLARERVKVVLSGDGGDETFAGYGRYPRHQFLARLRRWTPGGMSNPFLKPFATWVDNREENGISVKLRRALHQLAIGAREGYLHAMTITDARMRAKLFSADLKCRLADYDPLDRFREIYERAPLPDPMSRFFYLDMKTYMVDDILTKVDRASMANSLEVRVPLLDHKMVEFAYALPLHFKLREGRGKYLFRRTMERHLPAAHLALKKRGFVMPTAVWLRSSLRQWGEDILFSESHATPFLDQRGLRELWSSFQGNAPHLADVIKVALALCLSSPIWGKESQSSGRSAVTCSPESAHNRV